MDQDPPISFPDASWSKLDRSLGDLQELARDVLATQGRLRALLRANEAVVQQLELPVVLRRIVEVAVDLVGARYGALGVIAPQGGLEEFIHVGIPAETAAIIGHLPEGHGLLGALIDDPQPIRLPHLSSDPRSAGFPAGHPEMDSFLGVPIRVRDQVFGNLYLTQSAAGSFSEADEELVRALAATAGFAIDNARLFAETNRRQAWSAASAEINAALLSVDDDENDVLDVVASRVLELAGADLVVVALTTEDPAQLVIASAKGADGEPLDGLRIPASGTVAESVIVAKQPRLLGEDALRSAAGDPVQWAGPTMAVPLLAHDGVSGALVVSRRARGREFTQSDLELVADLASQASIAMELVGARADRQRMMILEDRGRIARDLHDHVIQQLFATGMQLQSVLGTLPRGAAATTVDAAIANIDAAIAQIRTAIFALSSNQSDRGDTVRHRIIDVVNELSESFATAPHLDFAGPIDLAVSGALADDVLAVVREGLTNAVKHASASAASVVIGVEDGLVTVEVVDDGTGIAKPGKRSGLANLEARATARGGSFRFESAPGRTSLTWTASYHGREDES